jgi:hypothetical protein
VASESLSDRHRGTPVTVGDLVIEPVERIVLRVERIGTGVVGLALKQPTSVVVRSPSGTFSFDLDEKECSEPDVA